MATLIATYDTEDGRNHKVYASSFRFDGKRNEPASVHVCVWQKQPEPNMSEKLAEYVEEIARAWASIDGKADKFDACKSDPTLEQELGHYEGYVAEARELLRRSPKTLHRLVSGEHLE